MRASNHGKGVGRREEGSTWHHSDGLFACVDQIWIDLILSWEWPKSQDAVLRLEDDVHTRLEEVGAKRGDADSKVDVMTILEFLGSSLRDSLPLNLSLRRSWDLELLTRADGSKLNRLAHVFSLHDPVYVDVR